MGSVWLRWLRNSGAALAVVATSVIPAKGIAADFDACCSDLEARIAELEDTAARKGNKKVSVTVSGWVNEAIFAWDDGVEDNIYIGTNTVEQSRFRFAGEAKINKHWSAGFEFEVGVVGHPGNQWNQSGPNSPSANPANREFYLLQRKSNWFVKNTDYGRVAVGLNSPATYHLTDDADATLTRNVNDAEGAAVFLAGFQVRINGQFVNGLRFADILRGFNNLTPGQSGRRDIVRYDTPTWGGFYITAAWGPDDFADGAVTYKGDMGDFSLLAKAGYGISNDPGTLRTNADGSTYVVGGTPCLSGSNVALSEPGFRCQWGGAAATLMHNPTGLFLYGGWGRQHVHTDHVFPAGTALLPTSDMWFLQPGIERKWLDLGKTNLFFEYRQDTPGSNPGRTVSAKIVFWQFGIVQKIDNADTTLYALYQHTDGEVTGNAATAARGAPAGVSKIDAFQEVVMGAKVNF
ncbi:porin [Hyphomicrobium sulfonivorans]|uniref:porin n=1 Tax=Hyphomicrobium sulfonivorans TaxID=121290 RepID=UPI00156E0366|nr:porin [Hyphomicrobium sulfonivorans]MBI1650461.1 porin [Hyphomicrobium sulfonivorans]NSL72179.1 porin [Hyphomicrobium sulfonivorans]